MQKVFHLKGKTRKTVKAFPFTQPNGTVSFTDNRKIADEFNKRFGAPVIPARETFNGAA